MRLTQGILLAIAAGAVNGLFALPMKAARKWSWENVWLPFSVLSLAVFPWTIAASSVPRLRDAYAQVAVPDAVIAVFWGACVYSGSLLFGISLGRIGTALAFSLLVGTMTVVGVLGPILLFRREVLDTAGGRAILVGVSLSLMAVVTCAVAGKLRAAAQQQRDRATSVFTGMVLAIAGGALSGLLSLGMSMAWAERIAGLAVEPGGAPRAQAQNAVLALVLLGGLLPNTVYSIRLLSRNRTWPRYKGTAVAWLIVLVMAVMYSGSVALWGVSTSEEMLGQLGPSVGWAMFIGAMVISSNLGGLATGEWRGAYGKPLRTMGGGVALMMSAMALVGYGNYLVNAGVR